MSITQTNFADILANLAKWPVYDLAVKTKTLERLATLDKAWNYPAWQEPLLWLALANQKPIPKLDHPRLSFFLSATENHEFDFPLEKVMRGVTPLNRFCETLNADLRLYELDLDHPVSLPGGAPTAEEEIVHLITYGMTGIEQGVDLTVLAAPSLPDQTALLLLHALLPQSDHLSGVAQIKSPYENIAPQIDQPLSWLCHLHARELAAMTGAILASYLAQQAVIIYDRAGLAAAILAHRLLPHGVPHLAYAGPYDDIAQKTLAYLKVPLVFENQKTHHLAGAWAVHQLQAALLLL